MNRYAELLDQLKKQKRLRSDRQAAKLLGTTSAKVSLYRNALRRPTPYAWTRLALELGLDPLTLIAEAEAKNENAPRQQDFWRDFSRRARKAGRAVILAATCGASSLCAPGDSAANSDGLTERHIIRMTTRIPATHAPPGTRISVQTRFGRVPRPERFR